MTSRDEPGTTPGMGARSVVLGRYHPDATGETNRTVHLLPLPLGDEGGAACALCGQRMGADHIETASPDEGSWCEMCFVVHVTGGPPAPDTTTTTTTTGSTAGRTSAVATYRTLRWPLLLHGDDVSLALGPLGAVALVLPALLGTEVTEILIRRRCAPAVLAHPHLPAHRIILASDKDSVPLGWPTGVHRASDTLLLPPSVTDRGPVFWVRPPEPNAPRLCREFDVFAALHTALRPNPPCDPPPRRTPDLATSDPPTPKGHPHDLDSARRSGTRRPGAGRLAVPAGAGGLQSSPC
ncbi:MAG: hypothetical protein GEU83_19925 [Pseudonocardiaceae bacterium]|nr:hypothetical protein [Pseudonocardiaceae bacterium]